MSLDVSWHATAVNEGSF